MKRERRRKKGRWICEETGSVRRTDGGRYGWWARRALRGMCGGKAVGLPHNLPGNVIVKPRRDLC